MSFAEKIQIGEPCGERIGDRSTRRALPSWAYFDHKDLLHGKYLLILSGLWSFSERAASIRSRPRESPCSLSSARFSDFQSL